MPGVYSRVLESLLLPAYYSVRGRHYGRYRVFLEESQWWSRDRLLAYQWEQLRSLLQHAFASVPYYQQKYSLAGIRFEDIRTREDFARLPPLTREELNEHRRDLCSTGFRDKLLPKSTGGSSGVPAHFFITTDSFDWRTAATSRAYSWSGCYLGEPTLYLWGAPIGTKDARWEVLKMGTYHRMRRELVFRTFVQNFELWDRIYRSTLRFQPKYVVGYVSSLEQFGHFLLETGRQLAGIQGVLAAAEPVYPATRDLLERAYRVPLFNTYGSREFMSIAAECRYHRGMHVNSENILVEMERSDREPSPLLITDLHNYGMPFIRYEIGDLGVLSGDACPCGRGLPLLHSVDGRVLDILRSLDGSVVPGEIFPHLMKEIQEVKEFQVRQVRLDQIEIAMVLKEPLSFQSRALLKTELKRWFGKGMNVLLRPTTSLPRLASGKRTVTVGLERLRISGLRQHAD